MKELMSFLEQLDERKIYYKINKVRDSILVEVAVPGQRWEVEFFETGEVQIEKFLSDGTLYPKSELDTLFRDFSD